MSKQNHFLKIVLLAAVLLKCTSKLNLEGLIKKILIELTVFFFGFIGKWLKMCILVKIMTKVESVKPWYDFEEVRLEVTHSRFT